MYNNQRYVRRRPAAVYEANAGAAADENILNEKCGGEQVYAMAYVKPQRYGQVYSDSDALVCGTLFPALCLPYEGGRR